jgi:hypothetical protein
MAIEHLKVMRMKGAPRPADLKKCQAGRLYSSIRKAEQQFCIKPMARLFPHAIFLMTLL